jgi:pyruvate dehydrogenase complex dehydrogenase (E1) component
VLPYLFRFRRSIRVTQFQDHDPQETREWLDALEAVVAFEGTDKARHLIGSLIEAARKHGIDTPYSATPPYITTYLGRRPHRFLPVQCDHV